MQRCGNDNGGYLNPISRYQNFGFLGGIAITATAWLAHQWFFPPPGNEVTIRANNFIALLELFQNISGSTVSNFEQAKQVIENTVKKISDLESIDRVFHDVNHRINQIWRDLYTDKTEMFVPFALSSMNTTRIQEDLVRLAQSCQNNPSDYLQCKTSKNEFDSKLLNISETNILNTTKQQEVDELKFQLNELNRTKQGEIDLLTKQLKELNATKQGEIDLLTKQLKELNATKTSGEIISPKGDHPQVIFKEIDITQQKDVTKEELDLITMALLNKMPLRAELRRGQEFLIIGGDVNQIKGPLYRALTLLVRTHLDNLDFAKAVEGRIQELTSQGKASGKNLLSSIREMRAALFNVPSALFVSFPDLEQFVAVNGITTLPLTQRDKIFRNNNQNPELLIDGKYYPWVDVKKKLGVVRVDSHFPVVPITENGLILSVIDQLKPQLEALDTTKQNEEVITSKSDNPQVVFKKINIANRVTKEDLDLITVALLNKMPLRADQDFLIIGGGLNQTERPLLRSLTALVRSHTDSHEFASAVEKYVQNLKNLERGERMLVLNMRAALLDVPPKTFISFPDLEQFVAVNGITTLPPNQRRRIFRNENQITKICIDGDYYSWTEAKEKLKSVMDASGKIKDMKITENGLSLLATNRP